METWNCKTHKFIEIPEKQIKFLQEIEEIYKKYDLSISHEDNHGFFKIEKFSQDNIYWLKAAYVNWL